MSGKNKNPLSTKKFFGQIQEIFVTRVNKEPEYYTLNPSPSPSPSPMAKRSRKRSSANFTLEDQSDDKGLSFSALARTKSQSFTPQNQMQQSDKEEIEKFSKNVSTLPKIFYLCFGRIFL